MKDSKSYRSRIYKGIRRNYYWTNKDSSL